jgi:hypothetical protein
MKASLNFCSRLFIAAGFVAFAAAVAAAQTADSPNKPAAATSAPDGARPPKKANPEAQTAKESSGEMKLKRGQYASEAEAQSHCRGTVVWVDQNNFNHYRGSREWAKKPGAYACEN